MPTNIDRRRALADAAVTIVARDGLRGLTHRAVDAEAGVPTGTTSNYLRSRDAIVEAAAERALDRLRGAPTEPGDGHDDGHGIDALARAIDAYARACLDDVDALLAWFELRLHAARADLPTVPAMLAARHEANVALGARRGLPGAPDEHRRLLHALDGVLLAAATGVTTRAQALADVDALVRGLVAAPSGRRWFGIR